MRLQVRAGQGWSYFKLWDRHGKVLACGSCGNAGIVFLVETVFQQSMNAH